MKTAIIIALMIIGAHGLFMKEIYRKLEARSQATLEQQSYRKTSLLELLTYLGGLYIYMHQVIQLPYTLMD